MLRRVNLNVLRSVCSKTLREVLCEHIYQYANQGSEFNSDVCCCFTLLSGYVLPRRVKYSSVFRTTPASAQVGIVNCDYFSGFLLMSCSLCWPQLTRTLTKQNGITCLRPSAQTDLLILLTPHHSL